MKTKPLSRREFIQQTALTLSAGASLLSPVSGFAADSKGRRMTMDLVCGAIGVSTMAYNPPTRSMRVSGISVEYTAGVPGSIALGSITIQCVESGATWTVELKGNAVKPFV